MVKHATFRPRLLKEIRLSGEFFVPGFEINDHYERVSLNAAKDLDFFAFYLFFKKNKLVRDYPDSDIMELFVKYDRVNKGMLSCMQCELLVEEVKHKLETRHLPYPDMKLLDLDGIAYVRRYIHHTLEDFNFSL